jgi:DNA-binding NtrC family response regulator
MKKRVLVVDDDESIRESSKQVLEGAGYEVLLAADGQAAIDQFSAQLIDVMILDLNLPIRDGWDAFEEVTRANPFVPTIIITGMANQYNVASAAGAGALLEKPIEAPLLLKTIEDLLTESKEKRLRRMCGYAPDTLYGPANNTAFQTSLRKNAEAPH